MKNIVLTIITFILVGATVYGIVNLYSVWQERERPAVVESKKDIQKNTTINKPQEDEEVNRIEIAENSNGIKEEPVVDAETAVETAIVEDVVAEVEPEVA